MTINKNDDKAKRKRLPATAEKVVPPVSNDGTNTPVPDSNSKHVASESEQALLKQAENPLGNPGRV
jgi:hypothetical protein